MAFKGNAEIGVQNFPLPLAGIVQVVLIRANAVGVLMTGMGDDGAEGLGAIKREGGMTIAQSEESCVVYGMPKAAIERGYAIRVVGLDIMGSTLQAICGRNEGTLAGRARAGH